MENSTMITTSEASNIEAIRLFAYFAYNYNHNFIEAAFESSGQSLVNHFREKFNIIYATYGSNTVMIKFFLELSRNNQEILSAYILNNYKG